MALDRDEMNRRRKSREDRRRKQQRSMMLRLILLVVVVAAAAVGLLLLTRDVPPAGETDPSEATTLQTAQPTETTPAGTEPTAGDGTQPPADDGTDPAPTVKQETEPETEAENTNTTVIHLAAAGDLVVNDATVAAGHGSGGYDYTEVFKDVAAVFSGADLAVLNFEGNLVGAPYGTKTVSAPMELAKALKDAGVDLVQAANSTSINHGVQGLNTTLRNLREAGLEPLGAFDGPESFEKSKGYTIVEVQGIRIAFVAFTKGVGGLRLPAGSEDCVNLLYTDYATTYQEIDKTGINEILSNVATEKPDLTIALVHWGSEYKDMVTKNQESIAKLMKNGGVDVILGTHPHMLHQVDYDPITGQMVAYSLGDFYSDAERAGTNYSIILDLEITRDNASGDTRVTDFSYTPIFTLTEEETTDGQRRIVRLRQAIEAYEMDFVGKFSEEVYGDMTYAMERITKRVTPEKPKEEE